MQIVPSILYPKKYAYELHASSMDLYDSRGSNPLCCHIGRFDTYGDGLTKHSPAYCPQFADLTDVCISFATAILAEPLNPEWPRLASILYCLNDLQLQFALTVTFKEGKRLYYSLQERKITSSDAKRNDRRFEEVNAYQDGTPKSAFKILCQSHHDWIQRVMIAVRLRELSDYGQQFEDIIPSIKDLAGDWHQALQAFTHALRGVESLDNVRNVLDCARNNSKPGGCLGIDNKQVAA